VYEALLPDSFFRIHKSHIVNLHQVSEVLHGDEQAVVLKNGSSLPVARERKRDLIAALEALG
jgi:two-component system LytT family response regulator